MTNRMREAPPQRPAPDLPPPVVTGSDRLLRRASLIAGTSPMLMAALAGFGNLVVVDGLVTPGDAARTARDILGSTGMFRLGVATMYVVVVLDVVIAWALLRVFSPVSRDVSRLAAWFRLAYSGVFLVALSQLAGIPALLTRDDYSAAFTSEQAGAQAMLKVDAFNDIWHAGLILFGAHLLLLGYLGYTSGYLPRALGVLLAVAGAGYAFDSFVTVFSDGSPFEVSTVTFVGELLLGVWLLVSGRRLTLGADGHEV